MNLYRVLRTSFNPMSNMERIVRASDKIEALTLYLEEYEGAISDTDSIEIKYLEFEENIISKSNNQ